MEVKNTGDIKEFIRGNDMFRKLEVALEDIRVGQGDAVFEGLQNGRCTVDIVWDGTYVHFYSIADKKVEPKPAFTDVITMPESVVEPTHEEVTDAQGPLPGEDPEKEDHESKRRRRGYVR